MIEPEHKMITVARQCELLNLSRASYYYVPGKDDHLKDGDAGLKDGDAVTFSLTRSC